ncbi:Rha family transcriptional regulator [Terasakiella pusilla]|uniref:Rha family transcriptional regulator n=1 Tax=Terasakiella pusilla TaxID=64973 RepID=UPI003AA7EF4E
MINQPIVHVKNKQVFANSRDVAEFFRKRHDNLTFAINRLECSENFFSLNFKENKIQPTGGGRPSITYDMTKDGFTFLVMGFTGKQASLFKEKYIQQFNRMEEQLRNQQAQLPDFNDPVAAARAWADAQEKKITPTQIGGICCEDAGLLGEMTRGNKALISH